MAFFDQRVFVGRNGGGTGSAAFDGMFFLAFARGKKSHRFLFVFAKRTQRVWCPDESSLRQAVAKKPASAPSC